MGRKRSIHEIDKAELHCHIDGILDPPMVRAFLEEGRDFGLAPCAFEAIYPIRTKEEWLHGYCTTVAPYLEPKEVRLPLILEKHIHRLCEQHVVYAEIMLSGLLSSAPDIGSTLDLFRGLRERADRASRGATRVEFTVAIARGRLEKVVRQVERIITLYQAGLICGFALAGDESACSVQSLQKPLQRLKETGMGIEIHAGEWLGPESVWDALRYGKPDRLGHGVAAFTDERVLAYIREHDIHLEFCPTSNLKTQSVHHILEHPIHRALELGMNFSVNTDDPGPFECSMTSEYELLAETFGFTNEDFCTILDNTCRSGFAERRVTHVR